LQFVTNTQVRVVVSNQFLQIRTLVGHGIQSVGDALHLLLEIHGQPPYAEAAHLVVQQQLEELAILGRVLDAHEKISVRNQCRHQAFG
jgi:hypothetical protein